MSNFVLSEQRSLVLIYGNVAKRPPYSLEELARLAEVHPDLVRYYCRRGIFGASRARSDTDPVFDDDALYELRRIEHYRRLYGVSRQAIPLLCELWRDVARLQAEVRFLRRD
jgi:DNA-binding transcriptional MerR regulator